MPFQPIPPDYLARVPPQQIGEELRSFRAKVPSTLVPSEDSPKLPYGDYQDQLYPLCGIDLQANGANDTCGNGTIVYNDVISRVSVYIGKVSPLTPFTDPFDVILQVRVCAECLPMAVAQFAFEIEVPTAPSQASRNGYVGTVGGRMGTRFEIWGRIARRAGVSVPPDCNVSFQLLTDRLGTVGDEIVGPNTVSQTGTMLFPLQF